MSGHEKGAAKERLPAWAVEAASLSEVIESVKKPGIRVGYYIPKPIDEEITKLIDSHGVPLGLKRKRSIITNNPASIDWEFRTMASETAGEVEHSTETEYFLQMCRSIQEKIARLAKEFPNHKIEFNLRQGFLKKEAGVMHRDKHKISGAYVGIWSIKGERPHFATNEKG